MLQAEEAGEPDLPSLLLQAECRLSLESERDNLAVRALGLRALELATVPEEKATVLALLAKAHIRLGETVQALACAEQALTFDHRQKDAYKRAATLLLQHGSPERVLQFSDELMLRGIVHSRLLSARTLAFSCLGQVPQAHENDGAAQFLRSFHPAPPAGWLTLGSFCDDLRAELAAHPDVRYNRYGTASAKTWRIDQPSLHRTPVFPALQALITREVQRYIAELPSG